MLVLHEILLVMVTLRRVIQELQLAESRPDVGSSKNITGGLFTWISNIKYIWSINISNISSKSIIGGLFTWTYKPRSEGGSKLQRWWQLQWIGPTQKKTKFQGQFQGSEYDATFTLVLLFPALILPSLKTTTNQSSLKLEIFSCFLF